jgi:hypothetical protein
VSLKREAPSVHPMNISDSLGFGVFFAWGVWWLLFPRSVLRFYDWFHHGTIRLPTPNVIRILGLVWCALMVVVFFVGGRK